ncbi:DsrE family protein [Natronomonas sp. EA1]|uniref:DsrE family protein n=1 Tax=Natronomonas sp. EA1 TaxID=3421655 RepID=UPI003EB93D35
MQVAFHVSSGDHDAQAGALRNVSNLLGDDTVDPAVALVVNSDAIGLCFPAHPHASRVRELLDAGVAVKLCANTLSRDERGEPDLLDGVEVVSSAMGELTRLQDAGYGYIRP